MSSINLYIYTKTNATLSQTFLSYMLVKYHEGYAALYRFEFLLNV